VVILGARNPLKLDFSSNIAHGSGVIETSLIPTPWPKEFRLPMIPNRITVNNTIPERANIALVPVCHLLILIIDEDVFRVVFILYLLIPILCMYLNVLFIMYIKALNGN
jgi:hypothetical protein